jgi:flavodoxin I
MQYNQRTNSVKRRYPDVKVLLVYDSLYGSTEKVARTIGGEIKGEVKILRVSEATPPDLNGVDLLIIGSPTQGGRATKPVQDFLSSIPGNLLKGLNIAIFDTRLPNKLIGMFGYAAGKIAGSLKNSGGNLILPPEGFIVKGSKGPLKEGELERAADWGKKLNSQDAKPG